MAEIHTLMVNDVPAFVLHTADYKPLADMGFTIVEHHTTSSLLSAGEQVEYVLTWDFDAEWYQQPQSIRSFQSPCFSGCGLGSIPGSTSGDVKC